MAGPGATAVMSLATIATMESAWLKQYAWSLNLVVSAIAFYHFRRRSPCHQTQYPIRVEGFRSLGGYLAIDGAPYDTVLSVVLLLAAVRLVMPAEMEARGGSGGIGFLPCTLMGMGIGLVSGVVGIGGGALS